MNKQNTSFWNKGISTPVGIFVIALTATIAGGGILAYQYWWLPEKEIETPEGKISEEITSDIVNKYVESLITRSTQNVIQYLTGEAKEQFIERWPVSFGTSNPRLVSFEILSTKKLNDNEFKFIVREYQEYTGEGIIGYNDETLIVTKVGDKYLIASIETGEYVDISEITNWKVYRNKKYGYEIKHPSTYLLAEESKDKSSVQFGYGEPFFIMEVVNNPRSYSLKEFYSFYSLPENKKIKDEEVGEKVKVANWFEEADSVDLIKVNGLPAVKFSSPILNIVSIPNENRIIEILTPAEPYKGKPIEILTLGQKEALEKFKEYKATFNQMLSTFRFLE